MKKMLSAILPGLLVVIFMGIDSKLPDSKNVIGGIYLFFPIIFIIQGIFLNSTKTMVIGFLLSSIAIILPISLWYNLSSIIPAVIVYLILGVTAFYLSNKFKKTSISKQM